MALSGTKVMVVEDDLAMQAMIVEFLELQGLVVKSHRLAGEALADLAGESEGGAHQTELVISDINMPQMSGIEFLMRARKLLPSLPVILITAFGSSHVESDALNSGATGYLNKPFKLSDLKVALKKAIS